jgi:hypothetical protein
MPEGVCVTPSKEVWYKAEYLQEDKFNNDPVVTKIHTSSSFNDRKKDPANKNNSSHGVTGYGGW